MTTIVCIAEPNKANTKLFPILLIQRLIKQKKCLSHCKNTGFCFRELELLVLLMVLHTFLLLEAAIQDTPGK